MNMKRLLALVLGLLMLTTTVVSAELATDTDIVDPVPGETQPVEDEQQPEGEEPAPEEEQPAEGEEIPAEEEAVVEQPEEKSYLLSMVENAEVELWIEYADVSG